MEKEFNFEETETTNKFIAINIIDIDIIIYWHDRNNKFDNYHLFRLTLPISCLFV